MAANGYTPIYLYYSSTATNVPSAGNLGYGELALNITDKNLFFKDNTNTVNTVPIRQSSASSNGWLSSTDWSTFNSKQPAGSYALTTGTLAQFASTTSAQLAGVISDETGSGSLVFATSPTLVTPVLGNATATTLKRGVDNDALVISSGTTTGSANAPSFEMYGKSHAVAPGWIIYSSGVTDFATVGIQAFYKSDFAGTSTYLGGWFSNGNFNVATGNLVIGTSGKGIDFSATPGTGTSELLADYEEGTHTATITCGTSGTVTLASTGDLLQYTKVGNIVTVSGDLAVSSVSSPVGYFAISLPFTVSSLSEYASYAPGICVVTPSASIAANGYAVTVGAGGTSAIVRTATGTSIANTSAQQLAANADIYFSITYRTA